MCWVETPELRSAVACAVLFAAGGLADLVGAPAWTSFALLLVGSVIGGFGPARSGLTALRHGVLDVDLLMVVAAVAAIVIDAVVDGALLILIFATSGALEALATRRTAAAVRGLLALAPDEVHLLRSDAEVDVPAASLVVDDLVAIRPGERLGADGEVIEGVSDVDEAGITGESVPVRKRPGDPVYAGTTNGAAALLVRVTRAAADTVVARISAEAERAAATKASRQLLVERIEQRYAVAMVAATVALFVAPLILGAALRPTLLRAMTFMIVASPCAVVLSTMPPLLAAMATANRHGFLIRSARVLEALATVEAVAFDKTGTLSRGEPAIRSVRWLSSDGDRRSLLAMAAAVELRSEHPIARAIAGAVPGVEPASTVKAMPGRGVRGHVNGRLIELRSPESTDRSGPPRLTECIDQVEHDGSTAVVITVDGRPVGVIGLKDAPRPESAAVVTDLTDLLRTEPVLLTGDNPDAAADLARAVGVRTVHARLLPAEKAAHLREMQHSGQRVMYVGDGLNDAPAVATADVGVAMGGRGGDLTVDTADAVIVRDRLDVLPPAVRLARRARRLMTANLVVAATVIVALIGWDLLGELPLPLGVAAHEGSTVLVGLNGLRLLRPAAWRTAGPAGSRQVDATDAAVPAADDQPVTVGPGERRMAG